MSSETIREANKEVIANLNNESKLNNIKRDDCKDNYFDFLKDMSNNNKLKVEENRKPTENKHVRFDLCFGFLVRFVEKKSSCNYIHKKKRAFQREASEDNSYENYVHKKKRALSTHFSKTEAIDIVIQKPDKENVPNMILPQTERPLTETDNGLNKNTMISETNQKADSNPNNCSTQDNMVPIGSGTTQIPQVLYNKIVWTKSYTVATRKLLDAVFDKKVLATHSLTGKRSPAFPDMAAKPCLEQTKVADIILEVAARTNTPKNLIRIAITSKCADENKILRQKEKLTNLKMNNSL